MADTVDPPFVETWLAARKIIAEFLQQLNPNASVATHHHNAAAIIARLASHTPPILLETFDESKK